MSTRLIADPMLDNLSTTMIVTRAFSGMGCLLYRGEVVDTAGWHNVPSLRDSRYLAALPHGATDFVDIDIAGQTRRFLDKDTATRALHAETSREALESSESAPKAPGGPTGYLDAESATAGLPAPLEVDPDSPVVQREAPKGRKDA